MKHIAIVPARAGSKSIRNKNLVKLGKNSLVDRTIKQAIDIKFFDEIVLTTDIPVLLEQYQFDRRVTTVERPIELASDTAVMRDVVAHAIEVVKPSLSTTLWLLQPTSPFRRKEDFGVVYETLLYGDFKSVISVCDVGAAHPNRTYTIKNLKLYPLRHTNFDNKQDLLPVYIRNGCFYVTKVCDFLRDGFDAGPCYGHIMPEKNSVNIDGPLDLALARAIA